MVQECNLQEAGNFQNSDFQVPHFSDAALEKILAEHPGLEFEVIQFTDGKYVQFHRMVRQGETRYSNFYFVKLNGS